MITDPTTISSSVIPDPTLDPTVQIATDLVTSNVTAMADKVQKVIEMIVGPNAKKYGATSKNLQLGFMFAGIFLLSPKIKEMLFGDKHSGKKGHALAVLGTVAAIIAYRKFTEGKTPTVIAATQTPAQITSPALITAPQA